MVNENLTELPEYWYCELTDESRNTLNNWRKNIIKYSDSDCSSKWICHDGGGWDRGMVGMEISFPQFKKWVLKEESKQDLSKTVIHCTTQEEWDYVIDSIKSTKKKEWFGIPMDPMHYGSPFNDCLTLDGKNYCYLEYYQNQNLYTILSFSDWCKQFNHTPNFMKVEEPIAEKLILKQDERRWVKSIKENIWHDKIKVGDYVELIGNDSNTPYSTLGRYFSMNERVYVRKEFELTPIGFEPPKVEEIVMYKDELLAKAKELYPIGTIIKAVITRENSNIIENEESTVLGKYYWAEGSECPACRVKNKKGNIQYAALYVGGLWATIVSKSEVKEVDKWTVGGWVRIIVDGLGDYDSNKKGELLQVVRLQDSHIIVCKNSRGYNVKCFITKKGEEDIECECEWIGMEKPLEAFNDVDFGVHVHLYHPVTAICECGHSAMAESNNWQESTKRNCLSFNEMIEKKLFYSERMLRDYFNDSTNQLKIKSDVTRIDTSLPKINSISINLKTKTKTIQF